MTTPLRRWRLRAGLTQAQLAERLGCSTNSVHRWEMPPTRSDSRDPPPYLWLALAAIDAGLPPATV